MTDTRKHWSKKTWGLAHETRAELARRFPHCIVAGRASAKRPLKHGIADELLRACPDIDPSRIKIAIAMYCDGRRYNEAMLPGVDRVGLDGAPAGRVTASEARHAEFILAEIAKRTAKKALAA